VFFYYKLYFSASNQFDYKENDENIARKIKSIQKSCLLYYFKYISIFISLFRFVIIYKSFLDPDDVSVSSDYGTGRGQVRNHLFRKAKRKALRMSIFIVAAFITCWTPYYVVFMYSTFRDLDEMPRETYMPLVFIGHSNSLINPMIYGAFQLCKVHKPRSVDRYSCNAVLGSPARCLPIL